MPMPRFNFGENQESEYIAYKGNKQWLENLKAFQRGYCHATTFSNWNRILTERYILPSGTRDLKTRFQCTDRSFAFNRNMVALFDFRTPTIEQVIQQWGNCWWDIVLGSNNEPTVLIVIASAALADRVVPNSSCWNGKSQIKYGCIPWCEVWFPDPIPVNNFVDAFLIPQNSCAGETAFRSIFEKPEFIDQ